MSTRPEAAVRAVAILAMTLGCREPTRAEDQLAVVERWLAPQAGYAYVRPVAMGSVVYFGTGDGAIVARDVVTGAHRWSTHVGTEMIAGWNLVVRSGVVVASVTAFTGAVDATSGALLWRYVSPLDSVLSHGRNNQYGNVINNHIDADDQTVFIPAWGASVSAVDLRSGAVRWIWRLGKSPGDTAVAGIFHSGAAGTRVSGDTVFVTAWHSLTANGVRGEGWLLALDKQTGRELWRVVMPVYTGGAFLQGAPALYRNLVIFTSAGGYCYAVDRTSHAVVWQHTPQPQHTTEAEALVVGDVVYIDGGDGNVYALNAGDGAEVWRSPVNVEVTTDFLATPARLIFASGRYLLILDRATGKEITSFTQPHVAGGNALFASAAAVQGNAIFITMNDAAWSFVEP